MRLTKEYSLAKKALDNSQVIAFPTETVMGLGVYYNDFNAYQLLNKVKNRPEDKPYTLMLGKKDDICKFADVTDRDQFIIDSFVPGPVTLLLKAKDNIPSYVTHNTGIIGVRVPDMKEIQDLIIYCGKPLLVPSANKSGDRPALTSVEVRNIFGDELGYILEIDSLCQKPSTIIDLTTEQVKILREGPISLEDIKKVLKGDN